VERQAQHGLPLLRQGAQTNTTSCTSTTVTKISQVPVTVRPGLIDTAETIEPAPPIQRVPLDVLNTEAQIQPTS
jgi:hypothetical protein